MVALDSWLDEPGHCRPCHGPIVPKTKLGMIRDYACYVAVLHWPLRFFMRFGMAEILPYAGSHAFLCTCWPKIAAQVDTDQMAKTTKIGFVRSIGSAVGFSRCAQLFGSKTLALATIWLAIGSISHGVVGMVMS